MRILHISADFPDPVVPAKTRAVANLLEITPEFEHMVYSLNRVRWPARVAIQEFGSGWRAMSYGALPMGLYLRTALKPVADAILEDAARRNLRPDVVHAHKLSIDGIIGATVAEALGLPLVLSCQGNTDLKVVRVKRDLRGLYRRLWRDSAMVFPFAPWTAEGLAALLGARPGPMEFLPCPTPEDRIIAPTETGPVLRSAFNLATHRVKNADRLIRAAGRAARKIDGLRLEIVGGGSAADMAHLTRLADAAAPGVVALTGPRAHGEMQEIFNTSAGVAMPSRRESYGMVFAEALLAGAPILHSKGFGFDGYLEDGQVSIRVAHDSGDEIMQGLIRLARDRAAMKARLAAMQESGALARFQRAGIADIYRRRLREVVGRED